MLALGLWAGTTFHAKRSALIAPEGDVNPNKNIAVATANIELLQNENPKPYVFAQSLPLTGPAAHLGRSYSRGIDAALREINQAGGINGRPVKIWRLDDKYEPNLTIDNTALFTKQPEVLGLFGYVGTPTTKAILNQAIKRRINYNLYIYYIICGVLL